MPFLNKGTMEPFKLAIPIGMSKTYIGLLVQNFNAGFWALNEYVPWKNCTKKDKTKFALWESHALMPSDWSKLVT